MLAVTVLLAPLAAACGGSSGSGSTPTLNWYIGKQSGGWIENAISTCNQAAGGKYTIKFQDLPARATDQREQLVRRLAANDKSIDIVGMDVIWTAEFANAGWIQPFPESLRGQLSDGVLKGPLESGTYKGKLFGAPFTSNTQLLWYRKDLQPTPAATWQEMVDQAVAKKMKVAVQGVRAESLTVTFNALLASAGGKFLEDPSADKPQISLEQQPTATAAKLLKALASSPAADPELSQATEDSSRQGFEKGDSLYELNYPFIYPSAAKSVSKEFQDKIGWARFPRAVANLPSRPPLGGFNLGISAYTAHPQQAFAAAACIRGEKNQLFAAQKGGNPPTIDALYTSPELRSKYPFADTLRESINDAAPRPVSPAYNDLSLAVQDTLHPLAAINPDAAATDLRDLAKKALKSEAVL
ncbi:MAG: extracellular solute-binding protein [Actinomycetota bacterium]|nr:extracellular solute-binding protein [Actinomycetota bacterium]